MFMAITASDLSPTMNQTSIFADRRKRQKIAFALDAINDRYGNYTVIRGQMWAGSRVCREIVAESAPERVGFRQTVSIPSFIEPISLERE